MATSALALNFKKSPVIDMEIDQKQEKDSYRSYEAQKIHSLVLAAAGTRDSRNLNSLLDDLEDFLKKDEAPILKAICELSINSQSHIHDALHLPFEFQKDKRFA